MPLLTLQHSGAPVNSFQLEFGTIPTAPGVPPTDSRHTVATGGHQGPETDEELCVLLAPYRVLDLSDERGQLAGQISMSPGGLSRGR